MKVRFEVYPYGEMTVTFQARGMNCSPIRTYAMQYYYALYLHMDVQQGVFDYGYGKDVQFELNRTAQIPIFNSSLFYVDIWVTEMGYDVYFNGIRYASVDSPYHYLPITCVEIVASKAEITNHWIEGNEGCPERKGDSPDRSMYNATTTVAPTTLLPYPEYFPPKGWPECHVPYCYHLMEFPCPNVCYHDGPYYCPPQCYVMPDRGYYPPLVYPPCNMTGLPSCLPIPDL